MNLRSAERTTGYEIQKVAARTFAALDRDTGRVITVQYDKRGDQYSLRAIVDHVWERRKVEALERAGWKCEECGGRDMLQVHHVKFRSHGRDDSLANLIVLDEPCHRKKHGGF